MAIKVQIRRDTAANWTSVNPTLGSGEMGYETDTGKLKFGDGVTAWTSLGYYTPTEHSLAGAEHSADTLANLNSKISDATLIDTNDSRLSDSRTCDNTFDNAATARTNLDVYDTATVDSKVVGLYDHKGAYDAGANSPDLDVSPSGVKKGDAYTVSVAGNFFAEAVEVGDVLIADQDDPTLLSHWTRVNKNISFGTTAGTACEGDDARLSDARTPVAHNHDAADVNSGTFADARIAQSNVVQHEGAITHNNLSGVSANEHIDWTSDQGATNIHDNNVPHTSLTNNPHSVTKAQVGLGNVADLKVNTNASVAPTATDDSGAGYSVGSRWFNTTADQEYVCMDASAAAAVWVETTAGAAGGEVNTSSNAGTGEGTLAKAKSGADLPFKTLKAGANITLTNNADDVTIDSSSEKMLSLNFGDKTGPGVSTTSATYVLQGYMPFVGTTAVSGIAVIKAASGTTGQIRFYNLTQGNVVFESATYANTGWQTINMGSVVNQPAADDVIEVQMKRATGTGGAGVEISSIVLVVLG